jgi:FG-GAP-like repeat/FG-GAP repeat
MRWNSFLRFLKRAWQSNKTPIRKRPSSRFSQLKLEMLESREMLSSAPPTIVAAGVLPVNGSSTTSSHPIIQVQFSDAMTSASALNASNYVLLGATSGPVPINSVAFTDAPADTTVSLSYNGGTNPLVVDTYTLYVKGNNLFDANNGLAMSQPGQLFAANAGRNDLAVVNVPGTGTLGTLSNYNIPATAPAQASPEAVAFGDLNGDGIPDLVVVNQGIDQVAIYAGQAGGGYSSTATVTLSLPAPLATPTSTAESLILARFDNTSTNLDIAVASGDSDQVTVFLNTSTAPGVMSFGTGTSYAMDVAAVDPVGLTAGDFDGDGNIDLAAVGNTAPSPIAPDTLNDFRVDIFGGVGNGTFNAAVPINVGSTAAGVTTPTSITSGVFQTGASVLPTLVVGGANGVEILTNTSTIGTFAFTLPATLLSTQSVSSLAAGSLEAGALPSIVDTVAGATGTVEIFQSDGLGGFAPVVTQTNVAVGGPVTIGDVNADGIGDILVPNGSLTATGSVTIFKNTTVGGTITSAKRTTGNPIVIASANNQLVTGEKVVIANDTFGAANGTFTITTLTNMTITSADVLAAGVVTITPTSTYGLAVGDTVTIAATGLAVANGTFTVASVNGSTFTFNNPAATIVGANGTGGTWSDPTKFTLNGSSGSSGNGAGGTWALRGSITADNKTAGNPIVVTSVGNNLATGDTVIIAGDSLTPGGTYGITILNGAITSASVTASTTITATVAAGSLYGLAVGDSMNITGNTLSAANGTFTVATIVGNTFTFTITAGPSVGSSGTGGTWINANKFLLNGTSALGGSSGGPSFGTWTTATGFVQTTGSPFTVDADPVAVAVADTNQDGKPDLVTANLASNDFSLLLGNGDGTYQTSSNTTFTGITSPVQNIIIGDLNGDGIADVIVANNTNNTGTTKITIYQGVGNGQYGAAVSISPGNVKTITGLAIGHFSAAAGSSASFPDIAYIDNTDSTVGFLRNQLTTVGATIATASFAAQATVGLGNNHNAPSAVAAGDFNKDGLTDLVVTFDGTGGHHGTKPGVVALTNVSTSGTNFNFNNAAYDNSGTTHIDSVAVGDFNNDGNLDFVVGVNGSPGQIIVNTNNGTGGFSAGNTFNTTVPNPVSISVGDFNNDGYPDIAVASSSNANTNAGVAVLLNQLGSGFGTAIQTNVAPGTSLQTIAVDDVNGDGIPDIVASTKVLTGGVTGTSASGTTPITVNVNSTSGLSNGMTVTISGVLGDTAANGTWTIANVQTGGGHTPPSFDLVGSTANANATANTGTWSVGTTKDNVFVLIGNGTGGFLPATPYLAGPTGTPFLSPTYLAVTPTPLLPVTTFTTGGNLINAQLVNNNNFEKIDLAGESGNLLGWQTFDEANLPGSAGRWGSQTGGTSPLSGTAVPPPSGLYQAMLDEPHLQPLTTNAMGQTINSNAPNTYSGSHALYQDVTIPVNATVANFSMSLYINNTGLGASATANATPGTYSDPTVTPSLDFNTASANQQVRVDIMLVNLITGASNPIGSPIVVTSANHGLATDQQVTITGVQGNTAANGTWKVKVLNANQFALYSVAGPNPSSGLGIPSAGNGAYTLGGVWTNNFLSVNTSGTDRVLQNLFQTTPTTPTSYTGNITASLLAYVGKTVRIRIASANNQGPLLIGADNVTFTTKFNNSTPPTLSKVNVANPSFIQGGVPYTNDPTITGTIGAPFGLSSISYVAFDPTNGNFTSPSVAKTIQWDAQGNFSYTLTNASAGLNTIGVEVVDRAGDVAQMSFTFYLQTTSVTQWQPVGPQGIDVTGVTPGVAYKQVSGRITATVADSMDPTGNTYLVGTANAGVWRTTDGGNDWLSVTNKITNSAGNPVPVSIGAMTQADNNPNILYAATGVGDDQLDSLPGVGILKSTNDGLTWSLLSNSANPVLGSDHVFAGARITGIAADPNSLTGAIVYVAVASGGTSGPGVYKTTDGGLTWNIITTLGNMHTTTGPVPGLGPTLAASGVTSLGSVTSMFVDPYNAFGEVIIGIGDIALPGVTASASGGVWYTVNGGASWLEVIGGSTTGVPNNTLPSGAGLGRVTVTMATGAVSQERYTYIMIANPPVAGATAPTVNWGDFAGLYKSSDNMLDFTKVSLMENTPSATPGNHNFVNINLLGADGANAGALIVSPTNPNVVFVGGSTLWGTGASTEHSFIYVDTGDMLDATTPDANGVIQNNGEDVVKYNKGVIANAGFYDPLTMLDPYVGEGVYWYDISLGASGTTPNNPVPALPPEITNLTFDSQGRLLIGTDAGLWRGVNNGFGYDYTSGGTGILGGHHGAAPFSPPGMSLTTINGNLSISDMTGVAIDPFNPGTYYTTQVDTGFAKYSPDTGWTTTTLTGPSPNGNNLGIPTAVSILTANPSTTGDPVVLYRIWEYANAGALVPEYSTDNGNTWTAIPGIPTSGTAAGYVPAFAINPTPLTSSGISLNQLLFGSSPLYETATSSTTWNPAGEPAGLAAGALPSAAVIAPSNDQVFYVGDDQGEIWYTPDQGATWGLSAGAAAGLPAISALSPVKGITVDPNNANELFVMYGDGGGGSTSHVFHSTNGGVNFTAVSGPWGSAQAYSMVIDRTPALGAPSGKIYLATQVGVYVSINNGASWSTLGIGMPNVPVVDLAYNANLQTLAAATLGRGIYTINTSAISVVSSQTTAEDTPSAVIPFTVNNIGAAYSLTATSNYQNLIPNSAIHLGGTNSNHLTNVTISAQSVQFTPALHAYSTGLGGGPGIGNYQGNVVNITAASWSAGTASITAANSFSPGQSVVISGMTPAGYDGTFTIATANGSGFTFALATDPGAVTALGTAQGPTPTITLTLTSPSGFSSTQSFPVSVTFVDYAPTVTPNPIANQTVLVNTISQPVNFTVSSLQFPAGSLLVTPSVSSSSNASLFPSPSTELVLGGAANITDASWAAGRVTITAANTFAPGQTVVVSGITPNGYDGAFTILTASPTSFTYALSANPNVVSITAATWAANTATMTAANTFAVGQTVVIAGMTPSGYNGSYTIVTASASGFTYALATDPGGSGTTLGTATESTALVSATATGANRTLTITPAPGQTGTAVINLQIKDANGAVTNTSFNLLVTTLVTLPFTDNFDRTSPVFVGPGWNVNLGAITDNGTQAFATGTLNIASLNGLNTANVALQMDVNVPSGGQSGLFARYGGVGDTNMYNAVISRVGATPVAAILKNVGGNWIVLTSVAVSTGVGTLAFDVVGSSLKLFYGPTGSTNLSLITEAFDTTFTTGTAGFRIYKPGTIDNFSALSIPVTTVNPLAGFSENFAVTGQFNQLNSNWQERAGAFTVASNAATGVTAGANIASVNNGGPPLADLTVQGNVTMAVGQYAGLIARFMPASGSVSQSFYVGRLQQVSATQVQASILKYSGGSWSSVWTGLAVSASANTSDTITFQAEGPSLKLFMGGNLIAYAEDFSLPTGSVGIYTNGAASVAAFLVGAVTSGTSLPFADNFGTNPPGTNGNQLNTANWVELAGNFDISTGSAVGKSTGVNTASVVLTTVASDVSVQTTATLSAVGQIAGLVARANAANNSYYVGRIQQISATQVQSTIFKYINGSPVQIGTTQTISGVTTNASDALVFQAEGPSLKLFLNGSLVAYAEDFALATGSVGMYTFGHAGMASFQAAAVTSGAALPFIDGFAANPPGTNGNQLDTASWVELAGNFNIATGSAVGTSTGVNAASVVLGTPTADVSVQATATLSAVGQYAGLIARSNAANNSYYVGRIQQVSATQVKSSIFRYVNGTPVQIGTTQTINGVNVNASDALTFQAEGPSLKLFLNGSLIAYAQDSTLITGSVGMYAFGSASFASGFQATALSENTNPSPPFSDSFGANPPGNQLNSQNWVERAGNFNVSSGPAIGQATVNLATVVGLVDTAPTLQATVNFTAVSQAAALVASYSGPGDNNEYFAQVQLMSGTMASGVFQATIYKYASGKLTALKQTTLSSFAGGMSFAVVGNSLTFTLDGATTLTATDASPLVATGVVGMRTYLGAQVASFSAS